MSNEHELSTRRRGYRINDWCEAFQTSRGTAYKMMNDGRLQYVEIGGRRFITNEAADALLKQD
jgi:predicted site-specific integrase-resolvase